MRARRTAPAAILAAALAMTASACGSSAPSASGGAAKSAGPLSGLSAYQIVKKAMTNTETAASVRIAGTVTNTGQSMTLDLSVVKGKGCSGSMSQSKVGSFKLVYDGSSIWIMPDSEFWKTQGGSDAAALSVLEGKYLKLSKNDHGLGALVSLCSLSTLMSSAPSSSQGSDFGKVTRTVANGQHVVKIADSTDGGYVYVSDTAKPLLTSIVAPGSSGGGLSFSYPAAPPAITAPPAGEVIDGAKYGF